MSTLSADGFKNTINLDKAITSLLHEIKVSEFSHDAAVKSKLALALTLINMSINSIPRVNKMFNFSQKLEDKIFDDTLIANMTRDESILLYKLSIERQTSSISFITTILNGIKWAEIEAVVAGLHDMRKKFESADPETSAIAVDLLAQMDRIKKLNQERGE